MEFAMFRLKHVWKRKRAAIGGFDRLLKVWLYSMRTFSEFSTELIKERAKRQVLLPFFAEAAYRHDLKDRFRRVRRLLQFTVSRFKAGARLSESKLLVLKIYWDRTIRKLLMSKKEKASHKQCQKLMAMDQAIIRSFLKEYLAACKARHAVAFSQWRDMYAPGSDRDQLAAIFASTVNKVR